MNTSAGNGAAHEYWTYQLAVPDDTPDSELDGYRELAISTWRTGAECMGGSPGEAVATLVDLGPDGETDRRVGTEPTVASRAWHIQGEVT
jgi:hypothetical protein